MPTQLPRVPSLIPSSFATLAIGRDVSITIFTASSLNSGEKLFFGRGNYFTFPDVHPNGWTVRKLRGTSGCLDDVGTCDLYVLILGHRYGFQPTDGNPDGLSITQLEFRRAGECGIPRIALLRTSVPEMRLSDLS